MGLRAVNVAERFVVLTRVGPELTDPMIHAVKRPSEQRTRRESAMAPRGAPNRRSIVKGKVEASLGLCPFDQLGPGAHLQMGSLASLRGDTTSTTEGLSANDSRLD